MRLLFCLFTIPLLFLSCSESPAGRAGDPTALPQNYTAIRGDQLQVTNSLLTLFSDPNLKATVNAALKNNPDLKIARAQLTEAGFNFRKSQSRLLPALGASGSASRSQRTAGSITNNFAANLDATWEVDVWGRIRSGVNASTADRAAVAADFADARQSLAAQTMQAWFSLVAAEKSLDLNQRRVDSFTDTEVLINRRFELGRASRADMALTGTDLANARADLQATLDSRDEAARRIQILTGNIPTAQLRAQSWPGLSRTVPSGLPSDLLRQRPDIAASYARILAADARVKVAHADLFPSFALTVSGGRNSDTLSNLARSSFNTWSLLGNLSAPLFDAGQRRAELGAAGQRAEQAFQRYQSTVLTALGEVENALGSERFLALEEERRLEALTTARRAAKLTLRDYEAGVKDLPNLLEAQRRVFSTEQQTINVRAARLSNRVALALALGKGT